MLIIASIHLADDHQDSERFKDECSHWFGQAIISLHKEQKKASLLNVHPTFYRIQRFQAYWVIQICSYSDSQRFKHFRRLAFLFDHTIHVFVHWR